MAGAGFKTFNTGDVLTASDVNTYLMQQAVMVFASAAARTTALGANVAEGMMSYLKDTNAVEVYDGSSWVASDDPNAIQNSIVDAKGDLISATADNTPARLASSGVNGEVLTIDTSTSTGLKWAAVSSAGWTSIVSGNLPTNASSLSITSIPATYKFLRFYSADARNTSSGQVLRITLNNDTSSVYNVITTFPNTSSDNSRIDAGSVKADGLDGFVILDLNNYADTTTSKSYEMNSLFNTTGSTWVSTKRIGGYRSNSAITSIEFFDANLNNFSGGTYQLWGAN